MNKDQGSKLDKLTQAIEEVSKDQLISHSSTQAISYVLGISTAEVERHALQNGIFPLRYARNRDTITASMQLQLADAHVAVVGCGGLGGHVADILARIGVGTLTLIDHDTFEEHNLNRQNFSTMTNIGQPKVQVLKEALEAISPTIKINTINKRLEPLDDFALLVDADVIVDALDHPQTKLELADVSHKHNKAFVHGAVAGTSGQLSVNSTLDHLYHDGSNGAEERSGNLPFTVTHVAAIQASETIKLLLGIGESLEGQTLMIDLLYNDFTLLPA